MINLISNNCIGGYFYRDNGIKSKNPFMYSAFNLSEFIKLIENYDTVNFKSIEVIHKEHSDLIKRDNVVGCTLDGFIKFEFIHHKYDETAKELTFVKQMDEFNDYIVKDLYYYDIVNYVISKYNKRVNVMLEEKQEPIFVFHDNSGLTDESIDKLFNINTKYRIILFTRTRGLKCSKDNVEIICTKKRLKPEKCAQILTKKLVKKMKNYKIKGEIISNDCLGGLVKKITKQQYTNPFIFSAIKLSDFIKLIKNFDKINLDDVKFDILKENSTVFNKKGFVYGVLNGSIMLEFPHHIYDKNYDKPFLKKHPNPIATDSILCNKIVDYVKGKWFDRLKRFNKENGVTFVYRDSKGLSDTSLTEILSIKTKYNILVITDKEEYKDFSTDNVKVLYIEKMMKAHDCVELMIKEGMIG